MTIYHLAEPREWQDAVASGRYERSTRGRSLEEVGFVHCSEDGQWQQVRRRFYGDLPGDLLLLAVDEDRLSSPVVREPGEGAGAAGPGEAELFPHVYGPLDVAAVESVTRLPAPHA